MNFLKKTACMTVSALLCLGLSGCGKPTVMESGFLDDYPEFSQGREGFDKAWIKEEVDFKKYNKIMLDHVVFFYDKNDEQYRGIHPEDINQMSKAYQSTFVEELNGSYEMVSQPAEDVLRVRIAITDLEASNPGLSTVATVTPIGLAASVVQGATGSGYTGVGSATMEVECLDSVSKERLAVGIDRKPGDKLDGMSEWGAVEGAFSYWAKRLKAFMDEVHGVKAE